MDLILLFIITISTAVLLYNPYIVILLYNKQTHLNSYFVLMISSILISLTLHVTNLIPLFLLSAIITIQYFHKIIINLKIYTFIIRFLLIYNLIGFFKAVGSTYGFF